MSGESLMGGSFVLEEGNHLEFSIRDGSAMVERAVFDLVPDLHVRCLRIRRILSEQIAVIILDLIDRILESFPVVADLQERILFGCHSSFVGSDRIIDDSRTLRFFHDGPQDSCREDRQESGDHDGDDH